MSYIWFSLENNESDLICKKNEQILVYCARSSRKIFVMGGTKVSVGGLDIFGMGGTGPDGGTTP